MEDLIAPSHPNAKYASPEKKIAKRKICECVLKLNRSWSKAVLGARQTGQKCEEGDDAIIGKSYRIFDPSVCQLFECWLGKLRVSQEFR